MDTFGRGFLWGLGFTLGATAVFIVMIFALGMGLTFLGLLAGA
jgi:hypothetical protein